MSRPPVETRHWCAGVDYPIYSTVPDTDFSCQGSVPGEYYADVATQCQVFHVCAPLAEGLAQRFSFLCPNGEYLLTFPCIVSSYMS